ncbi:MAG: hypothetical protein QOJ88_482 [Pyrinomonadaceae bacterium]|jgi:hypothetical protein|nr:hypothetical protein [Pyrinomonadaceae bacterium]MDQ1728057.1 hypothetical protein [Pyrinomonadaceae bacterium]
MKRFQTILCTAVLTLALTSTAFAGNISTIRGNISTSKGNISTTKGNISTSTLSVTIDIVLDLIDAIG